MRDLFPDEFPPPPEQLERQQQRGRGLARLKPWAEGRIGRIESRVLGELIWADIKKLLPVGTGWLVKQIYDDTDNPLIQHAGRVVARQHDKALSRCVIEDAPRAWRRVPQRTSGHG